MLGNENNSSRDLEMHAGQAFGVASKDMFRLTHVIYALHAIAVAIGVLGSATIVGSFLLGIPSIIAVVLNYLNRSAVRGTVLESHFTWQIRTFWFTFLWGILIGLAMVTIVGIPFALVGLGVAGIWVIYRVGRGWLALKESRPMPV